MSPPKYSRKLECVNVKMRGYRGLPVRKHSARDAFRRSRGLDFRVYGISNFPPLKVIHIYYSKLEQLKWKRIVCIEYTRGTNSKY